MTKKLIIGFLLALLLSNINVLLSPNKILDRLKSQHTMIGFTSPYLAKRFERKKFKNLVKMIRENRHVTEFEE